MSELPPDEPSIAAAGADSRQAQGRGHRGARRPDLRGDFGAGRDADQQMIALDPHAVASALGGNVSGCDVVAPGPGHSRADRSLSVKLDPSAPEGFIVHSFAGDSVGECREHVRTALGLDPRQRRSRRQTSVRGPHRTTVALERDADYRSARALWLWNQSRDPRGTVISSYLASRGLTLPDSIASDLIRFHSTLQFNGTLVPGMVALFRDAALEA